MLIVEQLVEKLFDLLGLEPVWPGSRESLYLTVVAVLVAIGFLSFLFFDIIRRWRRARRHHRSQPETWREILLKPIVQLLYRTESAHPDPKVRGSMRHL